MIAFRKTFEKLPIPKPKPQEILIQTKACGLNRPDLLQSKGLYPPPKGVTDILGLEASGIVVEVGSMVTEFKPGDFVFGLLPGGAFAEYCVLHKNLAFSKPESYSFQDVAILPEALFTLYHAIWMLGKLQKKETLFMQGLGSGLGSIALQLAQLKGIQISGSAHPSKHEEILKQGAYKVFDYNELPEIHAQFDLILDIFGTTEWNLHALKRGGRFIQLAFLLGAKTTFNLEAFLKKDLCFYGTRLRPQNLQQKSRIAKGIAKNILPLYFNTNTKPPLLLHFPFKEIQNALSYLEKQRPFGKIAISM